MRILGLDVSTKLGWAIIDLEGKFETGVIHFKKKDQQEYRIRRWDTYASTVILQIERHNIEVAIVEGYIHAGKFLNHSLFELGAIVRHALWKHSVPVVEVAPSALKKFATGKGNANKKEVCQGVEELWGFTTKDDNQADALVLAQIGRALAGVTGVAPTDRLGILDRLGEPKL